VEGGSRVNGSFLDEGLIDKLLLFLSPRLVGDPQAFAIFDGKGASGLKEAVALREIKTRKIGQDIMVEGYLKQRRE
jgi:diaminohydroxyphosphoribosylaminopyrimidine deaminase/5-amino-6-(5-phosphoribosylamino)uracil reductase